MRPGRPLLRPPPVLLLAALVVALLAACASDGEETSPPPPPGDPATSRWAVAAVDAATGEVAWGLPATGDGFEVLSGLVLHDGVLYGQWGACGADAAAGPAGLAAVEAATGKLKWRTPALLRAQALPAEVSVSTAGGVYVAIGQGPDRGPAVLSVELVGIDVGMGQERWRRQVAVPLRLPRLHAPVLPVLEASGPDGETSIRVVDRVTGDTVWRAPAYGVQALDADEERIYVVAASDPLGPVDSIAAFDARTGGRRWERRDLPGGAWFGAGAGGLVATVAERSEGERPSLVGLDASTGRQRWRLDGYRAATRAGNDATNGRIVVEPAEGEGEGEVAGEVLDLASGRLLWRAPPGTRLAAVAAYGAFVVSPDGTTVTLHDPGDGHELGRVASPHRPPDQVGGEPEVGPDGRVYFGRGCPGRG